MFDIVVYLLNKNFKQEILDALPAPRYVVQMVDIWKDVIRVCRTDLIDAILVWPATYTAVEDLIKGLEKNQLDHIPVIPMVRQPHIFHELSSLPLAGIMPLPIPKKEFYIMLHQVLDSLREGPVDETEESSREELDQLSLLDTLRKTGKNQPRRPVNSE